MTDYNSIKASPMANCGLNQAANSQHISLCMRDAKSSKELLLSQRDEDRISRMKNQNNKFFLGFLIFT